jgi:hypothetical protein
LKQDVPGRIEEAGAFKGGGTAKISLAAKHANRQLVVFDSFEGLPENTEDHQKSLLGHSIEGWFKAGNFNGSPDEVTQNVTSYGVEAVDITSRLHTLHDILEVTTRSVIFDGDTGVNWNISDIPCARWIASEFLL